MFKFKTTNHITPNSHLTYQINKTYANIKAKNLNKIKYTENGNKMPNTKMKLMHWNKGKAFFNNKINAIDNILETHKPEILSLSEANVQIFNNKYLLDHYDYKVETTKMSHLTKISRTAILIKNTINYKRRLDLEDDLTSTIWIEIKIAKSKPILVMAGYRQWQLPKILNIKGSKDVKKQLQRLNLLLSKWKLAMTEKRDTIVLMDDNLDTSNNSSHNHQYNLKDLTQQLQEHLDQHNIIRHNNKPTHFSTTHKPTCIDHIFSNCPLKITNTTTYKNAMSDHALLSTIYSSKENIVHPKYFYSRNNKLLTKKALNNQIQHSQILNDIFHHTDPNIIANLLQVEINAIINVIAPLKIIQYSRKYTPYYNNEIHKKIEIRQNLLNKAINTNDINDWREFNHYRNS